MKTGRDIALYGGRVEGEIGQVGAKLSLDLLEYFKPIFSPDSNLLNLEFTSRDSLTKVKVGKWGF